MGRFPKGGAHFFRMSKAQGKRRTSKLEAKPAEGASQPAAHSRRERISELLSKIEQRLDVDQGKVTLADFIRLIQLQRELEQEEQPAEVIITWKDAAETQSAER